jgi:RNA 3'-terminal phosphate cyclase (ATP)
MKEQELILIDGAFGEGGGQIVRTSLALSLVTQKPFKIVNIRANRKKPGLAAQHQTAVEAAARVGNAFVQGAHIGSREFSFSPNEITPGKYRFSIGTAGNVNLVLQTILPPLLLANRESVIEIEGGTHNQHAPSFEFIKEVFLPLIKKMGAQIEVKLERYGFYPRGGGLIFVIIKPSRIYLPLQILRKGERISREARALVVGLPTHIAERELKIIKKTLSWENVKVVEEKQNFSQGNVVLLKEKNGNINEIVTSIGERGVLAEKVATLACKEMKEYLERDNPVGQHLQDQLLVPLAITAGGSYVTGPLTLHTLTNIDVISKFLDVPIITTNQGNETVKIDVMPLINS